MHVLPSIQGTGVRMTLVRESQNVKQIIGTLIPYDGFGQALHCLRIVEVAGTGYHMPDCAIPTGHYDCKQHLSENYGRTILIRFDDKKPPMAIRAGNFFYQSTPCMLAGKYLQELDDPTMADVAKSMKAMQEISSLMAPEFKLTIVKAFAR